MSSSASAADSLRPGTNRTGSPAENTSAGLSVDKLKTLLKGNTIVPLLIAGATVVALIAALFLWASSPEYRVLFSNLGEADGGRIIAELDKRKIPYRFSEGGQAILVPDSSVHLLRLQLAEQGLPQGGDVGLELMDNQAFGISQFAEQVHFQRGLEGELARSIKSLGPVADARIHLAMAKPTVFVRDREPTKASVMVTLHPGRTLGEGQVAAITHLVASSVPNLAVENVTVVNQGGVLLSRSDTSAGNIDSAHLNYIQEVERTYQQRIENILFPLFGTQNVRIQVAAQIDFAHREETAERYGPNQAPNEAAVRSSQLSTSYTGSDEVARGIPGALSNTAPTSAPSPISEAPAADTAQADGTADANPTPGSARHDNVVNYEVDRNITHIQHQRGQIQRLSVAVVVNYRDGEDEEGNPAREPLNETEMEQVARLARQAMGFSANRGDELEVVNSPFSTDYSPQELQPDWWTTPMAMEMAMAFGRYLLAGLLALALYLLILRPLLRRHLAAPKVETRAEPTLAARAANQAASQAGAQAAARNYSLGAEDVDTESPSPQSKRRSTNAANYEKSITELREAAKENPRLVAIVIRSWMNKNE